MVKRVAQALKKGRDLSGVLNEELLNVEVMSRLSAGRGLEDILPKGKNWSGTSPSSLATRSGPPVGSRSRTGCSSTPHSSTRP